MSRPSRRCQSVPGSLNRRCRPPNKTSRSTRPKTRSPGPGMRRRHMAALMDPFSLSFPTRGEQGGQLARTPARGWFHRTKCRSRIVQLSWMTRCRAVSSLCAGPDTAIMLRITLPALRPRSSRNRVNPPRSGVNRRDLLRLRRTASRDGRARCFRSGESASGPARPDLLRVHRPGMGSFFEIRLGAQASRRGRPGEPGARPDRRARSPADGLSRRFRGQPAERDGPSWARLRSSPGCSALLERAVELSQDTGGAYDVTSGALSEAWGFVRGPKRVPDPETLADARARTGWQHLRLDREARTVGVRPPGNPDQPGEHRQGVRDRPRRGRASATTGSRPRRWSTAASRACSPRLAPRPVRRPLGDRPAESRSARDRPWACSGCGTGGWARRAARSSASRPTAGSTATSSIPGPASRPRARPA